MSETPIESFINYKADTDAQCGNYSIDVEKPKENEQYRFVFDMKKCEGCHCCEVACNEQHNNPAEVKWRRVGEMEGGVFPAFQEVFNSMSCNHCIDPECLKGCPTESYIKLDNGVVEHIDDTCIGCQYCTWNCPYQSPVYNKDRGIVTKCHMCHEKLDLGETPACIQACPTGAISIEVVNKEKWLEEDLKKEGVGPLLVDTDITKPTTRYVLPEIKGDLKPADERLLKPAHNELPLVFMTVLTQISLGGFLALILGEFSSLVSNSLMSVNFLLVLAVLMPIGLGLPLSGLHLGRPALAMSAMKNIKTSWLSREAAALGAFAGGITLVVGLKFFTTSFFVLVIMLGVFAVGLYGIYAQSKIYRVEARPSWNRKETTDIFLATSYVGFFFVALILALLGGYKSILTVTLLGSFIGFYQLYLWVKQEEFFKGLKEGDKHYYQLERSKRLYNEHFKYLTLFRRYSLIVSITVLPLITVFLLSLDLTYLGVMSTFINFALATLSELAGRYLFYTTVVPLGLAGNFFAGDQR